MKPKIIQQGAEAVISLVDGNIVKQRVKKGYRFSDLDERLIKSRTKSEAKILNKLKDVVDVPKVVDVNENGKIVMEFVEGLKLSENLEKVDWRIVCEKIGKQIAKIHDFGIIHGDLTTSNMILKNDKVFFIDFGLGFHSNKVEDKAVDLHLLKQALDAKHFSIADEAFVRVVKGYRAEKYKEILQRIEVIEKRGRYRR